MDQFQGLNAQEVQQRINAGEVNVVTDSISKTKKQIIREHTFTYFNALNLFLAMIIIFSGKFLNLTFIGVVITNTIIGIIQEFKVKSLIDDLMIVTVAKIKTLRDGQLVELPVEEIVKDDVLLLSAGGQIPTDAIMLSSDPLEVNEAMLTGESEPVIKHLGDSLMGGSFVISGQAYVKVEHVGQENYAAKLSAQAKKHTRVSSQMKDAIEKVIRIISVAIIPVGLILYHSQLAVNPDVSTAIVKTVGGVVGMIPEGLVLLTSLSFVLGVGILARKRALVQQMEAIEALSRVDVLCLDKTGTITTGDLKVEDVHFFVDEDVFYEAIGALLSVSKDDNPTSQALNQAFTMMPRDHLIRMIPFSSQRKYQGAIFEDVSYILGAPEFLTNDQKILKRVQKYSAKGYRVLMLGTCELSDDGFSDLQALGLIIISDVIKEDAKDTFAFFEKEGVSLKIISGDHPLTVSKVCVQAGLKGADTFVDASTLGDDIDEVAAMIEDVSVIGRVKPEQKQTIIKAFQKNGHVVGMVGDGVNDVLAIKDADCGIAMANGADAAKQAAHIVLLDSQFSSMKEIVKEGRLIIANIEKVSSLYLNKTIYSSILSLCFGIAGLTYPFTPFQLSLIGALCIGGPSFFMTLMRNGTLDSKGFFNHIIHTAMPCALTIVSYIFLFTFLKPWMHGDQVMYVSFCYLLTAFMSLMVVYDVFVPFDHIKAIVFALLAISMLTAVTLLSSLFGIYRLFDPHMWLIIPCCASALFYRKLVIYVIEKLRNFPLSQKLKENL